MIKYGVALSLAAAIGSGGALAATTDEQSASRSNGIIEEIVVTSRRRNESQQDVPISVTAFGPQEIAALKPQTLRDFDGLAPNVYIGMNTAGPSASAIYIRGVGYADIEKTQSPQVGVIVDGVQLGSSTGQLIDTFDVESIEVNRGPQGVLFGKNTIGGNIVVNRVRPQFNELSANVAVEFGNYDSEIYKARVNVPVFEDKVALKAGFIERQRDGFYDNKTLGGSAGDVDYHAQNAALRLQPWGENFDAIITYDRIRDNSQIPPQDPRFNGSQPFENLADKREPTDYDVDQIGARLTWDINENWTLYSITGYHDSHDQVNQDFDGGDIGGTAVPFAQLHTLRQQEYTVASEELRLHGSITEDIDLMVGIYYFDSELDFQQHTNNVLQIPFGLPAGVPCAVVPGLGLRDNPNVGNALCQFPNARSLQVAGEQVTSWAYFGSLTWRPLDNVEVSFGARYIDEEKDDFNSYFDFSDGTFDVPGSNEFDFSGRPRRAGTAYSVGDSWDHVILTATGSWAITDSNRVYVNYSEGFRSGGFSIRSARDPSEAGFDPEDAFQIEVGFKNEFFDRRVRANLAYFYLERDKAQFSSIIPLPPGSIPGTTTLINNGGKTEIQGVEFESTFVLPMNVTLTANFGVLDVKNTQFSIPCENVDGCVTATPGVLDPPGTPRVLGGNNDSRQPDWNYNLILAYDRQFGPGTLSANAGYKKVGDFLLVNTGGGADQRLTEGGYGQLDARLAYEWVTNSGGIMTFSLFGKNLTDEEWLEQALFLGGPDTGFQGWGAPRTYAFQVSYSGSFTP